MAGQRSRRISAPPARDLVDPRYYEFDGTDNLQTKRGCAFACAYCDYPDLEGRKVRVRDPDAIADEMLARSKVPGVTHMFFVDSVFNVPRSHALAVCDAIVDAATRCPGFATGRPSRSTKRWCARWRAPAARGSRSALTPAPPACSTS